MRKIATLLCEICVAAVLLGATFAHAVEVPVVAAGGDHRSLTLHTGTGEVVTLNGAATNVFVADPKVAEVRPASASTLFIFGVATGQTTVAAMDSSGHVLAQYNLTVEPSDFGADSAQAMIARLLPGTQVQVRTDAKGLLLTGSVTSPDQAAQAVAIAKQYATDLPNVENQIKVTSPIQVTLNVRIAEMSRTVVRNLGVNWQAIGTIGRIGGLPGLTLNANTDSLSCGTTANLVCLGGNFNGIIDALANDNLAHVLAEPNLTVMSGQAASFQVGGEYPIPVSQTNGAMSIDFKQYGIMLTFLPTVLSNGEINIHVKPEVSQLDKADGIQLTAGNSSITVPALTVRRAESTVELGSGQSFAIAGLLQQTTSDNGTALPGLGDTPLLGALFRDSSFQHVDDELVIIITPYIVRPVNNAAALHVPTEGYTPPTDLERLLLLHQVTNQTAMVPVHIPGDAGFIVQ